MSIISNLKKFALLASVVASLGAASQAQANARYYEVDADRTSRISLHLCSRFVDVSVIGDGDTDLDFEIIDPWGRVIYTDFDGSDATWTTIRQGSGCRDYVLRVINQGDVYNRFRVSLD